MRDDEAMDQALDAGAGARRRTAPNPWVGCVIVRDGEVVGRGATEPPGQAHAEIVAHFDVPSAATASAPAAMPRNRRRLIALRNMKSTAR